MGDLAVQHGFYGPEWDGAITNAQDEAGEALTVSDPKETWYVVSRFIYAFFIESFSP